MTFNLKSYRDEIGKPFISNYKTILVEKGFKGDKFEDLLVLGPDEIRRVFSYHGNDLTRLLFHCSMIKDLLELKAIDKLINLVMAGVVKKDSFTTEELCSLGRLRICLDLYSSDSETYKRLVKFELESTVIEKNEMSETAFKDDLGFITLAESPQVQSKRIKFNWCN